MRALAVAAALLALSATGADACRLHRYWHYPWRQTCAAHRSVPDRHLTTLAAVVHRVPTAVVRPGGRELLLRAADIPVPALLREERFEP